VLDITEMQDPGVVDEGINATVSCEGPFDQLLPLDFNGYIESVKGNGAAELVSQRMAAAVSQIRNDHSGAFASEQLYGGSAHSPGSAGNESHFVLQSFQACSFA
jgi:hypothetical protein